MGRKPFGIEKIFKILSDGVGESLKNELQRPINFLRDKTPLHHFTLRKYLTRLSDAGCVELTFGGHRGKEIVYLKLLKSDLPNSDIKVAAPVIAAPVSQQKEPVEQQSDASIGALIPKVSQPPVAAPIPTAPQPLVAVLVDFDNTDITAKENGFDVSFSKLLDYLRKFGRVMFADVFLSSASYRPEIVRQLNDAGFYTFIAPQGYKDKDAVDTKMNLRARDYLRETNIIKIVIVSRDSDFQDLSHFARNLHKETIFVNILAIQEVVRGRDVVPELVLTRSEERFVKIIDCLANGLPVMAAEEEKRKFVKDIILAILRRENNSSNLYSFKPLCVYVTNELCNWRKIFSLDDYKDAISALVQRRALIRHEGHGLNYYKLHRKHPAVETVLGVKSSVKSSG